MKPKTKVAIILIYNRISIPARGTFKRCKRLQSQAFAFFHFTTGTEGKFPYFCNRR